jgi:hypothetical protein
MKNKDYLYWGSIDLRYEKVFHNMELLGIVDITTNRQHRNGTVVWRLPIKNTYSRKGEFIEVASYEAGYVRVLNTCMSPYYINKPIFRHTTVLPNYSSKKPKLIPIEIERLEYLISYCLKNMYIKLANKPQTLPARFEMNALQNKLANSVPKWKYDEAMKLGREQDLALKEEVKRYDNAVQPLEAQNENLEYEVADLNNELCRVNDKIIQLKQDIAVTEANTELFREVNLSAYNKMIKIKEIIGC